MGVVPHPDVIRWRVYGGEVWLNVESGEVEFRPSGRAGEVLTLPELDAVAVVMRHATDVSLAIRAAQAVLFAPLNDLPF